jgi:uncharacterized protein with LGFP repeats
MRARELLVARSTRPAAVVALSLALVASAQAEFAAATTSPRGHATASTASTAATVTDDNGVPPTVHELSVPAVPHADRAEIAASTGSRAALVDKAALPNSTATSPALVAHVESPVAGGFSMLGVTWARSGNDTAAPIVAVRTKQNGTWSRWTEASVDPDEGPSAAEESSARDGTAPIYVGRADSVEVDVYTASGTAPADLKVAAIDPGTTPEDTTLSKGATAGTSATRPTRDRFPSIPRIVTRREWGADERLGDQCWAPRYGNTFKAVFVHHTAGSNSYTRRESPSIVRGIYAYHTQSRDWCDIGYNFLIDRYGTTYEGRAGGIRQPVRGAHAGDYNVNSTGISLMGEFTSVMPTKAMRRALIKLISWRLGVAYHGGHGFAFVNGKRFNRISGHRDAMSTSCPGQRVYDWLPRLRNRVDHRIDNFRSVIKRYYINRGGSRGALGPVRIGEVGVNGGRHTTFTKARTYFKNGRRRTFMRGPFLSAYIAAGEVNGPLGYPISRLHHPRRGSSSTFEGGSLYWSHQAGSHVLVRGKVFRRYLHLNGAQGVLGFPETNVRFGDKGSSARFQHGVIRYDKKTGRTTVSFE